MPLYSNISRALTTLHNNPVGPSAEIAQAKLDSYLDLLPSGGGFDSTPTIDHDGEPDKRYTISGSYHAMDENGGYIGWIDFTITVFAQASLTVPWDFTIECDEEFEDYIAETYNEVLSA